ncbi:MAG: hypothetical protein ACHP9W_00575 [Steroidobacterales bacterium]
MRILGYSAELLLALLLLVLLVAIPIKVGAHLADARRKGLLWCALAAVVGVLAGHIAARVFGGLIGGSLASFVGFIVAIRYLLGTTLAGALGLTIIALIVSLAGIWLMAHFWFVASSPGNVWAI